MFPVLVALRQWSEEFSFSPGGCPTLLVDRDNGQPVRKLELHARDGRLLGVGDTDEAKSRSQAPPAPLGLNDVSAGAKMPARTRRGVVEPGLAAKPDVFLSFQLRHPQEMTEHLKPMPLCRNADRRRPPQ